ncbi:MAG TPA: VWA domain-containing protein [Pyrinomonadaceae bacterium]|nr:VWA domain-containing protein [Pyrinomonadaceae bacterium]
MKTAILSLVLGSLALSSTLLAQEPNPPVAKPAGPTVRLSLIVTDSKDKSLDAISKDDLRILDDTVEQTILSVEADVRPVDLGIAIDASGSFLRYLEPVIKGAKLMVVNRNPKDEIFLERFISSDKIETLQDFTSDQKLLTSAVESIYVEGGQSAVIDAVYMGVEHIAGHNRNSDRRKALVVFTDGEDRNSYYNVEKLLAFLHKETVQIFVVGLILDLQDKPTNITRAGNRERAIKLLTTLAEETGGRVFFPRDDSELGHAIAQIVHDLDAQFRITYQSSNTVKKNFRKVEVKVISLAGENRKAIVPRGYETQ